MKCKPCEPAVVKPCATSPSKPIQKHKIPSVGQLKVTAGSLPGPVPWTVREPWEECPVSIPA
eukprot:1313066-Lingulodinium_polyedra.AAC.1